MDVARPTWSFGRRWKGSASRSQSFLGYGSLSISMLRGNVGLGGRSLSMKTRLILLIAVVGLAFSFQPALAQDCVFQLGFKALHDLIPDVVGDCLDNERHNPAAGITKQSTTNGQLIWRKADNWTGFTDGQHTWINGPQGLAAAAEHRTPSLGNFGSRNHRDAAPDTGPSCATPSTGCRSSATRTRRFSSPTARDKSPSARARRKRFTRASSTTRSRSATLTEMASPMRSWSPSSPAAAAARLSF